MGKVSRQDAKKLLCGFALVPLLVRQPTSATKTKPSPEVRVSFEYKPYGYPAVDYYFLRYP